MLSCKFQNVIFSCCLNSSINWLWAPCLGGQLHQGADFCHKSPPAHPWLWPSDIHMHQWNSLASFAVFSNLTLNKGTFLQLLPPSWIPTCSINTLPWRCFRVAPLWSVVTLSLYDLWVRSKCSIHTHICHLHDLLLCTVFTDRNT